jgi:hypothetical protein
VSQQINLFNPVFLKQKKVFTVVPMAEALGVILLGALALAYYGNRHVAALEKQAAALKAQLTVRQARLASVDASYAPRQKNPALEAELALSETKLKALRDVMSVLQGGELGNRQGYADYFRALARQSVGGLWLTGVSIGGAGLDIGVQGRAMQAPLIPTYIARLTGEPIMRGKTFSSLEIGRPAPLAAPGAIPAPAAPYVEFNLQSSLAADGDQGAAK